MGRSLADAAFYGAAEGTRLQEGLRTGGQRESKAATHMRYSRSRYYRNPYSGCTTGTPTGLGRMSGHSEAKRIELNWNDGRPF